MTKGRWHRRSSLWLANALLAEVAAAQPPLRLLGRSHWWIERQGAVAAVASDGAGHELRLDFDAGEALTWRFADLCPILEGEGARCRLRIAALVEPDLLVVEIVGRDRDQPFALQWPAATTVTDDGCALLELDGGHRLAVLAPGAKATRRRVGGAVSLPPAGGHLLLAMGRDAAEVVGRPRALVPALPEVLALFEARWAMRLNDGLRLRTGHAAFDEVLRRAQRQLVFSTDAEGRIWDQCGTQNVAPTPAAAVDAAAALASCGLEAWSQRVLDAAAAQVEGAELGLLQARARRWRAGGRLSRRAAWESPSVTAENPRICREPETGHRQPVALVPDLVELTCDGAALPELDAAWFAAGERLLLATDPVDERLACWHLWLGSRFFDLPDTWQQAVARTAPQAVAKLLLRDGTLALRTAIGRPGLPGADRRASPVATALLALWRLQRGDRSGAWRSLVALADRQQASGDVWLPWAWNSRDSAAPARDVCTASAALVVLAALEVFVQPDGAAWRVGLPDELAACELRRLPLGSRIATLHVHRSASCLAAELATSAGHPVRLVDDSGATLPLRPRPTTVGAPQSRALPEPMRPPATLEHLVLGGPAYQRRFVEATALLRQLAAVDVEVVRTRRQPSPAEEQRAITELQSLSTAVERAFELGLGR